MDEGNILKEKLIDSYNSLDLDNKRNEFSKEMVIISSLINSCLAAFGETNLKTAYDYKSEKDLSLTEDDLISKNYSDILEIKNNLLTLLTYINNK